MPKLIIVCTQIAKQQQQKKKKIEKNEKNSLPKLHPPHGSTCGKKIIIRRIFLVAVLKCREKKRNFPSRHFCRGNFSASLRAETLISGFVVLDARGRENWQFYCRMNRILDEQSLQCPLEDEMGPVDSPGAFAGCIFGWFVFIWQFQAIWTT